MRNYLPAPVRRKRVHHKPHVYLIAVIVPLILATAAIWYRSATAAPPCRIIGIAGSGPFSEWTAGNYHYKVWGVEMAGRGDAPQGTIVDNRTMACEHTGFFTNTNDSQIDPTQVEWNGIQAVGMFMGVPNMGGANNNGMWTDKATTPQAPFDRVPVFERNWKSQSALVDDGARTLINGKNGLHTVWCVGIDTNSTDSRIKDCPPDISGIFNGQGAGYLQSAYNCHIGDPASGFPPDPGVPAPYPPTNYDYDASNGFHTVGPYACPPAGSKNAYYNWMMAYQDTGIGLYNGSADISNFVGCQVVATCDNVAILRPFDIYTAVRQGVPIPSSGLAQGGFDAITYFTLKYPVSPSSPQLSIAKIADKATYQPGDIVQYIITVSRPRGSVKIASLSVHDDIPNSVLTYLGTCNPAPNDPTSNAPPPVDPTFDFNSGRNALQLNRLNNDNSPNPHFTICLRARVTGAIPGTFRNFADMLNVVAINGRTQPNSTAFVDATLVVNNHPFLTTTGGDVNAGGGIGVSCAGGVGQHNAESQ